MTMQVQDKFTVKMKRKEHPNARKYPGRPSLEFGTALRKFMSDLNDKEREEFRQGKLVFEEDMSAEFFDSVQEGDVIGVGLLHGIKEDMFNKAGAPSAYMFEVLGVDKAADMMQVKNVTFKDRKGNVEEEICGQEMELAFEDLSASLGLGFGEILERDGKPFGVSEEIEQEIIVVGPPSDVSGSNDTTASSNSVADVVDVADAAQAETEKQEEENQVKNVAPTTNNTSPVATSIVAEENKQELKVEGSNAKQQYYYKFDVSPDQEAGGEDYGDDVIGELWVSKHSTYVDDNEPKDLYDATETVFKNVGIIDDNIYAMMEGCWAIFKEEHVKLLKDELDRLGWKKGRWIEPV